MADTKKEHYVPKCYLENFEGEDSRIKVYDKAIMQIRNQLKSEIAAKNYFYDIDFDKMMQRVDQVNMKRLRMISKNSGDRRLGYNSEHGIESKTYRERISV